MFSKLTALSSLFILAVATTTATAMPTDTSPQSCSTGPIQCCQTTETAGSPDAAKILGLLGVVVQDLNVLVGINCSPITVIGVSGSNCDAQPVCCENNSFNGVVAIGCTPININA